MRELGYNAANVTQNRNYLGLLAEFRSPIPTTGNGMFFLLALASLSRDFATVGKAVEFWGFAGVC